jgi:hypothetical protein
LNVHNLVVIGSGSGTFNGTFIGDGSDVCSLNYCELAVPGSDGDILINDNGIIGATDTFTANDLDVTNLCSDNANLTGSFTGSFIGDGSQLEGIISSPWTGSGGDITFPNQVGIGSTCIAGTAGLTVVGTCSTFTGDSPSSYHSLFLQRGCSISNGAFYVGPTAMDNEYELRAFVTSSATEASLTLSVANGPGSDIPVYIDMFHTTTTATESSVRIWGDNSSTPNHVLNGRGDSYLNLFSGSLGIGTGSTDSKLHVAGNVKISSNIAALQLEDTNSTDPNNNAVRISLNDSELRFQYLDTASAGTGNFVQFERSGNCTTGIATYCNAGISNFIGNDGTIAVGTGSAAGETLFVSGSILMINGSKLKVTRADDGFSHEIFTMDGNDDIIINRSSIVHGKDSGIVIGVGSGCVFDIRDSNNNTEFRFDENSTHFAIGRLPTTAAKMIMYSGSLPTTTGSVFRTLQLNNETGNQDSLIFEIERTTTGSDWQTATHKIGRLVDSTEMGNIKFGTNSSDLITFGEGSTEYMRIDGDGKVGINTTSPTALLEIEDGNFYINNTGGHGNPLMRIYSETGNSGDYFQILDSANSQGKIDKFVASGSSENALIDINPIPSDQVEGAYVRLFRETNTAGTTAMAVMVGDGTATTNNFLSGNIDSYLAAVNGNVGIGLTNPSYKLQVSGTIAPDSTGVHNLGDASNRWNTVYTSDLSLSNEHGDWTIVEGSDDLFLYNNKKDKVYKFKLEEVDKKEAPPKKS